MTNWVIYAESKPLDQQTYSGYFLQSELSGNHVCKHLAKLILARSVYDW